MVTTYFYSELKNVSVGSATKLYGRREASYHPLVPQVDHVGHSMETKYASTSFLLRMWTSNGRCSAPQSWQTSTKPSLLNSV